MPVRPAPILNTFRDVWRPDWAKLDVRIGLRIALAIGCCLAVGYAIGSPGHGALAASGALAAGFGAFERIRGSSVIPMLMGTAAIGIASFAGTLFGHSNSAYVALAAVAGLVCGVVVTLGPSYWYIALQAAITGLVSGEYPDASVTAAGGRALLLIVGGLLQTAFVAGLRRWRPLASRIAAPDRLDPRQTLRVIVRAPIVVHAIRRRLGSHLREMRWLILIETARLTLAVACSAWASRWLRLEHGYWAPMTTLLVMKSDLHLTVGRGLARVTGTLAGVALSATLLLALHPAPALLCVFALLFAWLCFALVKVNYAIYSICITGFVVSELAFLGETSVKTALLRGFATMLGFTIAIGAHLTWNLRRWLEARRRQLHAAIDATPGSANPDRPDRP